MDYIWIVFAALSAILLAIYGKKVDKAQHPGAYKKTKKGKKAKKQKAQKPLRENRVLEFSMAGLFIGIVVSFFLADKVALIISACFFAGIVLGMIFRKKTYVESLDELDIEDEIYLGYTAYQPDVTEPEEKEEETVAAE